MRTVLSVSLGAVLSLVSPLVGAATNPAPALVPRHPTGFSTIEQRYVYAQPDEGVIEFPLQLGVNPSNELIIEEPSICNGSAFVRFTYSKSKNKVTVEALFKGLPYRMSASRPDDPSTPWNQWPTSVTNGKWQLWLAGKLYNKESIFYYDATTLDLIGNEYDLAKTGGPPPDAIPQSIPVLQMIETPLFEGKPNGEGYVRFEWPYDHMLDDLGTAGTLQGYLPKKLCRPDEYTTYYTNGGIPAANALTFDDFIDTINSGYGTMVAVSLEPDPKPAYLLSRDNIMVAWSTVWPGMEFDGRAYTMDAVSGAFQTRTEPCGTHVGPKLPPAYYDFCGP